MIYGEIWSQSTKKFEYFISSRNCARKQSNLDNYIKTISVWLKITRCRRWPNQQAWVKCTFSRQIQMTICKFTNINTQIAQVDSLAGNTSTRAAAASCAEIITIVTEITTIVASNPENSTVTKIVMFSCSDVTFNNRLQPWQPRSHLPPVWLAQTPKRPLWPPR